MSLTDRPDFQEWLRRFEERHERIHGDGPRQPPPDRCDGCGQPVEEQVSSTGLCAVCLAEIYGSDRSDATARIATKLREAIAAEPDAPPDQIRSAVDDVLDAQERRFEDR